MLKIFKMILKAILISACAFVAYVLLVLLWGTITDYQPENMEGLGVTGNPSTPKNDSIFTLMTWNIGYAGLGSESSFFFDAGGLLTDAGAQVRPTKAQNQRYFKGIKETLKNNPVDFLLLQEVDKKAKRSYDQNQYDTIAQTLNGTTARSFATNYKVSFVPLPLLQPWQAYGHIESGLATYSRYPIDFAFRDQLKGNYGWPDRIFQLDRCISTQTISLGKHRQLFLINVHNSAFDDGSLRKQQLKNIENWAYHFYMSSVQEDGEPPMETYLIIGGDWNQYLPNFKPPKGFRSVEEQSQIPPSIFKDWQWVYDDQNASNRTVDKPYGASTKMSLIDGYVVSPNVEVLSVKTLKENFKNSDHEPVLLKVKLK